MCKSFRSSYLHVSCKLLKVAKSYNGISSFTFNLNGCPCLLASRVEARKLLMFKIDVKFALNIFWRLLSFFPWVLVFIFSSSHSLLIIEILTLYSPLQTSHMVFLGSRRGILRDAERCSNRLLMRYLTFSKCLEPHSGGPTCIVW